PSGRAAPAGPAPRTASPPTSPSGSTASSPTRTWPRPWAGPAAAAPSSSSAGRPSPPRPPPSTPSCSRRRRRAGLPAAGGDRVVGVGDQLGDLLPVDRDVEVDPEPAAVADIGRPKVSLGVRGHQRLLVAG